LEASLQIYRQIGYPVCLVSALTGHGMTAMRQALDGRLSVLVGKSGVGKSTLLNALQPGLGIRVHAVSRGKLGKGLHTTTHQQIFQLDSGGMVVDTPGMRVFGLWDIHRHDLAACFPEMRPFLGACKYGANCRHDSEAGCAIRAAVMTETIHPLRYRSFLRLQEEP
jgi:ribosome biogenesis GTPase / thiamine phosphate phosphatase